MRKAFFGKCFSCGKSKKTKRIQLSLEWAETQDVLHGHGKSEIQNQSSSSDDDDSRYMAGIASEGIVRLSRCLSNSFPDLKRRLHVMDEIGTGASSTVFRAVDLKTLKVLAVKRIQVTDPRRTSMILKELRALRLQRSSLDSRSPTACLHIVEYYGDYFDFHKSTVHMIMEYIPYGSLQNWIENRLYWTEEWLAHISFQALQGILYLHEHGRIHRDVKPANLLITSSGDLKLSDFGISCSTQTTRSINQSMHNLKASTVHGFAGTFLYMAPERLEGKEYSENSDVWGFGLSLLSVIMGSYPFQMNKVQSLWDLLDLYEDIENGTLFAQQPLQSMSEELKSFLSQTLTNNPAQRPTAKALLDHPFLEQRHQFNKSKWQIQVASSTEHVVVPCELQKTGALVNLIANAIFWNSRSEGKEQRRPRKEKNRSLWSSQNKMKSKARHNGLKTVLLPGTECLLSLADALGLNEGDLRQMLSTQLLKLHQTAPLKRESLASTCVTPHFRLSPVPLTTTSPTSPSPVLLQQPNLVTLQTISGIYVDNGKSDEVCNRS